MVIYNARRVNFQPRFLPNLIMHRLFSLLCFPLWCLLLALPGAAQATGISALAAVTRSAKSTPAATKAVRAPSIVTATGAGQAGYVHFWIITAPDGEQEIQVGMELADRRIAWSFPGVGVTVTPFIATGEYDANGRRFTVEHQFGLRPYRNEAAVNRLQANLPRRVKPWIDNSTPYCPLNGVTAEVCVSCFGFVAQMLYPGRTRMYADFPRDFPRVGGEETHSSDDLLLYLTGLHALRDPAARQRRMELLGGPAALREELARVSALVVDDRPTAVAAAGTKRGGTTRTPLKPAARPAVRPG